ncbi:hypothetical protein H2509_05490 [Stappia sp. F7233]|uniref:Uncharacterized protein n=1 Tax=Stappia albiluteola TaxID=2758565 RepID=A0A839ABS4_9HYPH|nr:hypothetical protein [Stappia albiluteola]MBA5776575.1 hypothetical protein [Stappia albiluteola]
MISRYSDGAFHSSHQLFTKAGDGLYNVSFCGTNYWTRPRTVAWMQWETENGRNVNVEFNGGKGWLRVCLDPQEQVKLADLGIGSDYTVVLALDEDELAHSERFSKVRKGLEDYSNSGRIGDSYHKR